MEEISKKKLPPRIHLGRRILKTAAAVYICFLIYLLRGERGIPFFSAIAAIMCMQPYVGSSGQAALERGVGTLVGALYGSILLSLYIYGFVGEMAMYVFIAVGVVFVIESSVLLKMPQIAYFSCVVFLSIVANHIKDANPFLFVLDRVLDTFIGIGVALLINRIRLPRKRRKDILFVSSLDDTLLCKNGTLTNYSKIELNRIIGEGASITIATQRTPASLQEQLRGVELKLPVVAMNGAVLYDMENNKYVRKHLMQRDITAGIAELCRQAGVGYFVNIVVQDVLLIYFTDIKNEFMQEIYRKNRQSPYRNYICGNLPKDMEAAYFHVVDEASAVEALEEKIKSSVFADQVYFIKGEEKLEKPGTFLKIYGADATKEIMTKQVQRMCGAKQTVSFGSIPGKYDVVVEHKDDNEVVRTMKALFYKKAVLTKYTGGYEGENSKGI